MTPEEIRAAVDLMAPRATPEGRVNARHVAIETTLREKYGHPLWIAELDQPGAYLPLLSAEAAAALRSAADQLEGTGAITYSVLGDEPVQDLVAQLVLGRSIGEGVAALRAIAGPA